MESLTIGQLAREAGVHVETIRYYQRRRLLTEPRRPASGIRRYGADALARLGFIRRAQETGFTLEEIQQLIQIGETPGCRGARDIAARKLALMRSRMADLERMSEALTALIAQCDAGRKRRCPIIEALGARNSRSASARLS